MKALASYFRGLLGKTHRTVQRNTRLSRTLLRVEQLECREVPASLSKLALDFGPAGAPVQAGFTGVSNLPYQATRGYGFTQTDPMTLIDRGAPDALRQDFAQGHWQMLEADMKTGWYTVTLYMGDQAADRVSVQIYLNGVAVATVPATAAGQFAVRSFSANCTNGRLNIWFVASTDSTDQFALDAIKIAPLTLTANAGPDRIVNEGQSVAFNGQATGIPPLSYSWTFGDGASATGTLQPSHTYRDQGRYLVTLTVTDGTGVSKTDTAYVTVKNVAPTATFTNGGDVAQGNAGSVSFTNQSDSPADLAAGFRYSYDFNNDGIFEIVDSANASATVPASYLSAQGPHTIRGRIKDKDNAYTIYSTVITVVTNNPPTATFNNGGTVNEGSAGTVSFANAGGGTGPYTYSYDFNNDGTFEVVNSTNVSATVPATYLADGPGSRVGKGRIKDSTGAYTDYTTTITINNVAPSVTLASTMSGTVGTALVLAATVTDPSTADTTAGFTYLWNFGDGSATSTLAHPSHTFATPGTYTVSLTVQDKDNGATTKTSQVTITQPAPVGDFIVTPYDKIPNFGAHPTIVSIQSGNWSDPATWSTGVVPAAGDVVSIDTGFTVIYDVVSDAAIDTVVIQSGGHLIFRTDVSTRLTLINFLVLEGGELQVGTVANPVAANVKAEVIFADVPIDTTKDPSQYGHGLIALGKVTVYGAVRSDTFVRVAAEPKAGDTTLLLPQPEPNWRVGDRIVLPDTRQWTYEVPGGDRWEMLTIQAISADSRTITFSQPIQYDHLGARNGDGVLEYLPYAGNVTRNVVIHSQSATGTRAYTMFTGRADVDIRYAQFGGLGRSTIDLFDDTKYDSNGNVTHIATNQEGRYPITFNHLIGPASGPADGYQYTFVGNSVLCPLNPMKFRWGIDIHGSHYGLIQDNVLYNWAGAGIITEDGSESYNVIDHNYVLRMTGVPGTRADGRLGTDIGFEGAAFWFRGPNNYVRNNVAANAAFGFTEYQIYLDPQRIPAFQGADPSTNGQYTQIPMVSKALMDFSGNETYGTPTGLTLWWLGAWNNTPLSDAGQSVIRDFVAWHTDKAYYGYQTRNITFDHFVARGDASVLTNPNHGPLAFWFSDYMTADLTITNSNVQGFRTGYYSSSFGAGITTIKDSYFRNVRNIYIESMGAPGSNPDSSSLTSRTTVVQNVKFASVAGDVGGVPQFNLMMVYSSHFGWANIIQSDTVYVYDYNQVAGDSFQLYYEEQAPDFILPQTSGIQLIGSPQAGLTNQQNWDLYGIAFAGTVAPTTQTRGSIKGFVRPL